MMRCVLIGLLMMGSGCGARRPPGEAVPAAQGVAGSSSRSGDSGRVAFVAGVAVMGQPAAASVVLREDGWLERQARKDELVKALRKQAKDQPSSRLSLTEKQIEDVSRLDNPEIQ